MKASISGTTKKRGRPKTTGPGVGIQVRLQPAALTTLDRWIKAQPEPRPSRPEAIRRLVEQALATAPKLPVKSKARDVARIRAEKVALEQIDRLLKNTDQPEAAKAERKRRLIRGPAELRKRPAS